MPRYTAGGLATPVLPWFVWGVLMVTAMTTRADATDPHPRLLVRAEQYDALRARAGSEPWRSMRDGVRACTTLTYQPERSVYSQYSSMTQVMRQAALAVILYPDDRQIYIEHIVAQLAHWDELNVLRRQRPTSDWASMINGGDAFFTSILALDIIYNDLTAGQLAAIEARLQTWYEYERDVAAGSWYLAKYGAMGLWALYKGDHDAFESHARAYDNRLREHFTDDGVALVGGSYASARLAGGELAKTYFMDVLTYQGWHDYYNDPLLGAFYEWFYTGMLTPTSHYAIFQDCREARHSGTSGAIANHRAHRFSRDAAGHAAWLQPQKPRPGLLGYVIIDEPLPEPLAPASHLWDSGYATLWESAGERALMGALWAPNRAFQHDHYEINAIHLTGYGQTLLRNAGYEGWGNPPAGFSWNYLSRFDLRAEWDHAVSSNIAYLDRTEPHVSKGGAGLVEGILHPALDFATGDAGEAVKDGHHLRTLALIKDRTGEARPYYVLFDEMTRTDAREASNETLAPLQLSLHPAANDQEVVAAGQEYRWAFDDEIYLTIFLATPTGPGTRLKRGGLSQFDEAPMYLHAEFVLANEQVQALTVLFPHEGEMTAPRLHQISGRGWSGVEIGHGAHVRDVALATHSEHPAAWEGIELEGRAAIVRLGDGTAAGQETIGLYHARQARRLRAGGIGFESVDPISITVQGVSGLIRSPGTRVTFYGMPPDSQLRLNEEPLSTQALDGGVAVEIPPGSHTIDWTP